MSVCTLVAMAGAGRRLPPIDRGPMSPARRFALFLSLTLATVPAQAQTTGSQADALKASLLQLLSLASFGTLTVQPAAASVIQEGSVYQVRLPLSGLSAPPDAAVTAVARPLQHGRFDIASMTFPSSGTLETVLTNGTPSRITFAIGRQTASAQVGPTPAAESSYTADFGDIQLQTLQAGQRIDQRIDRFASDGTMSAAPGSGRVSFSAQSQGTGLHMVGHGDKGVSSDTSIRAMAGHVSVDGLDQVQATHLAAAARAFIAGTSAPATPPQRPGQPAQPPAFATSPAQGQQLRAIIGAATGLLNRFEVNETMEDIRFRFATRTGAAAGTIGNIRLSLDANAVQDRLNGRFDISVDGIATPSVPIETATLMPHHVNLRTVMAGVRIGPLTALLRAAADGQSDAALLQAQATALIGEPGAHIGIEALSFDAGPLAVTGSANLRPHGNGRLGGEIHLAAQGVDALLAQMQRQSGLQQALPLIFLAKGLGRPEGDSLVWDITLGDGPLTVNGLPFGQPAGRTR
jgi:hypothetical protein